MLLILEMQVVPLPHVQTYSQTIQWFFFKKTRISKEAALKWNKKKRQKGAFYFSFPPLIIKQRYWKCPVCGLDLGHWRKFAPPSLIVHKYSKDRHSTDWSNGVNQKICFHCCIKLTTLQIITVTQAHKSAIHWTPSPNGHNFVGTISIPTFINACLSQRRGGIAQGRQ